MRQPDYSGQFKRDVKQSQERGKDNPRAIDIARAVQRKHPTAWPVAMRNKCVAGIATSEIVFPTNLSSRSRQAPFDFAQHDEGIDRCMGLRSYGRSFVHVMRKSRHVAMMRRVVPPAYQRSVVTLPMEAVLLDGQYISHISETFNKLQVAAINERATHPEIA